VADFLKTRAAFGIFVQRRYFQIRRGRVAGRSEIVELHHARIELVFSGETGSVFTGIFSIREK